MIAAKARHAVKLFGFCLMPNISWQRWVEPRQLLDLTS
jgi:hypothetical protein